MDVLSRAEFACDRCGFKGEVDEPFAGCFHCGSDSTLKLLFSPDDEDLRQLFAQGGRRKRLATLQPLFRQDWISLGEGETGLTRSTRIGPALGLEHLYFKNEGSNPTGSFKDRYVALTINIAKSRGFEGVVVSSTGNLGVATAAYATAAGLKCVSIVGSDAPGGFIRDGVRYGAFVISSTPSERFKLFELMANRERWFPMGLFMPRRWQNPFGVEAYRAIAYEVALDLGAEPDVVVFPAARGNNLYGAHLGFQSLRDAGVTLGLPRLVAVQPRTANTIEQSLLRNLDSSVVLGSAASIATSVAEVEASKHAIKAIRLSDGCAVSIDEAEISAAMHKLELEGFIVEPASALPVAALPELIKRGLVARNTTCVLVLTGAGWRWGEQSAQPHLTIDPNIHVDKTDLQKLWANIERHFGS